MVDGHSTIPSPTQAHAYLGNSKVHHTFKFNPNTVQWSYKENTVSMDTIGGRVVQLLSINIEGMSVEGVAGSRDELQRLATNISAIMDYHVATLLPVTFRVPSRRWDFRVYVQALPQMGWDVAATSYPYALQLLVVDDITGVQKPRLQQDALARIYKGVGYNPNVHGGNTGRFQEMVSTVTSAAAQARGPLGGTAGGLNTNLPGGQGSVAPGTSGIDPNKNTLTAEDIARVAAWAIKQEIPNISPGDLMKNTIYATAVCFPESGGRVDATNPNATNRTAYGLWQADATQNGLTAEALQTAEGNATWMAREIKADYGLAIGGDPYALNTWEHAWWAYWGAFRSGAYQSHMSEAKTAAKKVL